MILTEKLVSNKKAKNNLKSKIYINTLIPNFEFKNKIGKIIKPIKRCITL